MEADLQIKNYDGDKYYMWDAQQNYWAGHEWNSANPWQPVLNGNHNGNYPKSNTDPRYYNDGNGSPFNATHSCATLPNANEMSWYVMYGDPRWDADELWTTMGHLYQGGMWFKKKSVLQAEHHYDTEKSADGSTDLRTTRKDYNNTNSSIKNSGIPSAADANNYFYLPALGYYMPNGMTTEIASKGSYWSSSAYPRNNYIAYYLRFFISDTHVYSATRNNGFRVEQSFD